jgi:hypothetical protein
MQIISATRYTATDELVVTLSMTHNDRMTILRQPAVEGWLQSLLKALQRSIAGTTGFDA